MKFEVLGTDHLILGGEGGGGGYSFLLMLKFFFANFFGANMFFFLLHSRILFTQTKRMGYFCVEKCFSQRGRTRCCKILCRRHNGPFSPRSDKLRNACPPSCDAPHMTTIGM